MKYLSVCSGIEAATVAWHPLGWEPVAFAEIERFPSAVLKHHYSTVPNLGDMNEHAKWALEAIDVLVGGTPCQSFSVAGLRQGLADPRGGLMLRFLEIAQRHRPRWVVWENVPGVLSSNGGRDFGSFLGALGQLGYGWAYRVLDAQWFGVAQRRRRVFVVGCAGDQRRAAQVLFERESVCRNPAPRREARQRPAISVIKGAAIGRQPNAGPQYGEHLSDGSVYTLNCTEQHAVVAPTLSARTKGGGGLGTDAELDGALISSTGPVSHCLNAGGMGRQDYETETETFVAARPAGAVRQSRTAVEAVHRASMQVRRLTPRECERLQGFPDDWTAIPWRGRPASECPDGPRYKALGNSMAVPVMRWIGERIAKASDVLTTKETA